MAPPESLYDTMPRMKQAIRLLDELGETATVTPPDSYDHEYNNIYTELAHRQFRPTLLEPAGYHELTPGTNVVVWERGGTKIRLWVLRAKDQNTIDFIKQSNGQPIGIELAAKNHTYASPEDFFVKSAQMVQPAIDQIRSLGIAIHALANIYSYDSVAEWGDRGIYLRPNEHMSKGGNIPGISNILVGNINSAVLKGFGIPFIDDYAIVDLNDGPAVMLSVPFAHFSDIGGTGNNHTIALEDNEGKYFIWNMETGDLDSLNLSVADYEVNRASEERGRHLSEMVTGGGNIGAALNYHVGHMIHKGLLSAGLKINEPLTAAHFSDIIAGNPLGLVSALHNFSPNDHESWKILEEIARRRWQRAGYGEGKIIAAAINLHESSFPEKEIFIPTDGSKFWRTPQYHELVKAVAQTYIPNHTIHFIEASGARGAGFAALRQYAAQHS